MNRNKITHDPVISSTLKELNDTLLDKLPPAYVIGYTESLMVSVLTAFVPASDRYRMLDFIKETIEKAKNVEA